MHTIRVDDNIYHALIAQKRGNDSANDIVTRWYLGFQLLQKANSKDLRFRQSPAGLSPRPRRCHMAEVTAQVQLTAREGQLVELRKAVEVARALADPGKLPIVLILEPGETAPLVLTNMPALEHWLEIRQIMRT